MNENEKLTNGEILRQQMELLAERSVDASVLDLPRLTFAMVEIFKVLEGIKPTLLFDGKPISHLTGNHD